MNKPVLYFFCATLADFLSWRFIADFPLRRQKKPVADPSKTSDTIPSARRSLAVSQSFIGRALSHPKLVDSM